MGSRREIDKEEMFRKIMPSAFVAQKRKNEADLPQETPSPAKQQPAAQEAVPQQPAAEQPQISPVPPAQEASETDASQGESPILQVPESPALASVTQRDTSAENNRFAGNTEQNPQQATVSSAQPAQTQTQQPSSSGSETQPAAVNVVELLIEHYYPIYQKRLSGCDCEKCRDDVYGIALNNIRPRYKLNSEITKEDMENRELITETVTALMKALFIVKRNPKHDG